ncbi:hypothetical protein ACFW4H_34095 [Streptomyces rochei]|uniref:hypothetical protein n=1 Tax=Streptomyces rochei TaxID=1928 RepID=UPI0036A04308
MLPGRARSTGLGPLLGPCGQPIPGVLAEVLVGGVMLWFGLCWYVLPLCLRRRAAQRSPTDDA